jgi:aminoglycoside phosphotransferase (APT) family kinase protein
MLSIPLPTLHAIVAKMEAESTLLHAEQLVGGASAEVILLHVQRSDGTTERLVLRVHSEQDREHNPDVAQHEFMLLQTLYEVGLPVAQPRFLDVTGQLYPVHYLLVGYIEGSAEFSPRDLTDFIDQSAALLAKVHQAEVSPALNFLSNRAELALWWIGLQPDALDAELDEARLRAVLRAAFPLQQVNTSTLLHGDFWAGNLIWREGKLVGLIDWEDAEIGDPLSDLAISRLEMLWAFGADAMQQFTAAYKAHMPYLDYGNLPYWDLFSALRPAGQLRDWAAAWVGYGRPDVTVTTMTVAHQWFVEQALGQIGITGG